MYYKNKEYGTMYNYLSSSQSAFHPKQHCSGFSAAETKKGLKRVFVLTCSETLAIIEFFSGLVQCWIEYSNQRIFLICKLSFFVEAWHYF